MASAPWKPSRPVNTLASGPTSLPPRPIAWYTITGSETIPIPLLNLLKLVENIGSVGVYLTNHILYIIAEGERKFIPTFKEVLTNRKKDPLKCCHVYNF